MAKYMKFKENVEPCVQYEVLDENEVMEYDEITFKKYVPHILFAVIGLLPKELMSETSHPDNTNCIDLAITLTNLSNEEKKAF